MAGSSVGPSTPQFQLKLSFVPSRLSSPLASLCLSVVGDQIVEREAVVGGDEVDAAARQAVGVLKEVALPDQVVGRGGPTVPASPLTKRRTWSRILPVPDRPAVAAEVRHLIQPGRVPGLGDDLRPGEHGIGLDVEQDRRLGERLAVLAARQARRPGRSGIRRRACARPNGAGNRGSSAARSVSLPLIVLPAAGVRRRTGRGSPRSRM